LQKHFMIRFQREGETESERERDYERDQRRCAAAGCRRVAPGV